jgi:hypothetical protein
MTKEELLIKRANYIIKYCTVKYMNIGMGNKVSTGKLSNLKKVTRISSLDNWKDEEIEACSQFLSLLPERYSDSNDEKEQTIAFFRKTKMTVPALCKLLHFSHPKIKKIVDGDDSLVNRRVVMSVKKYIFDIGKKFASEYEYSQSHQNEEEEEIVPSYIVPEEEKPVVEETDTLSEEEGNYEEAALLNDDWLNVMEQDDIKESRDIQTPVPSEMMDSFIRRTDIDNKPEGIEVELPKSTKEEEQKQLISAAIDGQKVVMQSIVSAMNALAEANQKLLDIIGKK